MLRRYGAAGIGALVILVALLGCSRAVTGGYADSSDGKYRCWIRQFGPYNYSPFKRYKVSIQVVEIIDRTNWVEKPLFTKYYHFKDPDVQVNPTWDLKDNLTILLFEYPNGISKNISAASSPSNLIETISLILDQKTGMYHQK